MSEDNSAPEQQVQALTVSPENEPFDPPINVVTRCVDAPPVDGVAALRRSNTAALRRAHERAAEAREGKSHFLMRYIEANREALSRLQPQVSRNEDSKRSSQSYTTVPVPLRTMRVDSDCGRAWAIIASYGCNLQLINIFEKPYGENHRWVGIYHREFPDFLVDDKLVDPIKKHLNKRAAKMDAPVQADLVGED